MPKKAGEGKAAGKASKDGAKGKKEGEAKSRSTRATKDPKQ